MLVSKYIGTTHEKFKTLGVLDSFLEIDAKYLGCTISKDAVDTLKNCLEAK